MKLKDAYKDFEVARVCIDVMRNGKYVKGYDSEQRQEGKYTNSIDSLVEQFPNAEGKLSVYMDKYGELAWQFEFNGTVEESEITELTDALNGRR